ncbi:hypothetical protein KBD20_04840 [Candidatus Saccharibacteria bacterium]|nr:hypothetical protein [Candidatus Saccharibacteria bacterium]
MIKQRLQQYEERMGNNLMLNIAAKIGEIAGFGMLIEGMATNATAKEGLITCAVLVGSTVLDVATGGLKPYSIEKSS